MRENQATSHQLARAEEAVRHLEGDVAKVVPQAWRCGVHAPGSHLLIGCVQLTHCAGSEWLKHQFLQPSRLLGPAYSRQALACVQVQEQRLLLERTLRSRDATVADLQHACDVRPC